MDALRDLAKARDLELRDGSRAVSFDAQRALLVMRAVVRSRPRIVFAAELERPVEGIPGSGPGRLLIVHERGETVADGPGSVDEVLERAAAPPVVLTDADFPPLSRPQSPEVWRPPSPVPLGSPPPRRSCGCLGSCLPL